MSEDVDIKAGISMHPGHPMLIETMGEDETEVLKMIKSPQMVMPSSNEADSVMRGGLTEEVLGGGVQIIEFPDMGHGWTVRGDLSVPVVKRDVDKAFNLVLDFFHTHL